MLSPLVSLSEESSVFWRLVLPAVTTVTSLSPRLPPVWTILDVLKLLEVSRGDSFFCVRCWIFVETPPYFEEENLLKIALSLLDSSMFRSSTI